MQRVRKALDPPGEARDDIWILSELARRLGRDWGEVTPATALGRAAHAQSDARAACPGSGSRRWAASSGRARTSSTPARRSCTAASGPTRSEGTPAPFSVVEHDPPVEALDAEFPIRLTTGRRLESYNTGVQSGSYRSPLHRGESLDLSPEDMEQLGVENGEIVLVSSRRGAVEAPVRMDRSLRPGLAFMTLHFPDQVDTNQLTIDATDPRSGTAEFKAAAIRVEKIASRARGGRRRGGGRDELMDLRQGTIGATAEERDAVASLLGPAVSRWEGGERAYEFEGHIAHGGHEARDRRHLLLPVLQEVQARVGWISEGALEHVSERLTVPHADVYGVATFYGLLSVEPRPRAGAARLRGPRLPLQRLGGADRRARGAPRPGGLLRRGRRHLAARALPRPVRSRAGRAAHARRRGARASTCWRPWTLAGAIPALLGEGEADGWDPPEPRAAPGPRGAEAAAAGGPRHAR